MIDPESLIHRDAYEKLLAEGFEAVSSKAFASFGDTLVELRRGRCEVLLGTERGEPFMAIRATGTDLDYDMAIWEACIDGRAPALHARRVEADVDELIRRLPDLDAALGGELNEILDCLRDAGLRRFQRRRQRGLIKPPP